MKRSIGLLALLCACGVATATPYDWLEYNAVQGSPLDNGTYTAGATSSTLEFDNAWIKNTGPTSQDIGFYFAWMWVTDTPTGTDADYIPLAWNNATQTFHTDNFSAPGHTLDVKVEFEGISSTFLPLSTVGNETGTGPGYAPWGFSPTAPVIAPDSSWSVPFVDLGVLAPGDQKNFGLKFTQTFNHADDVNKFWGYEYWGQNVVPANPVPEPATMAILGIGAMTLLRRRKKN